MSPKQFKGCKKSSAITRYVMRTTIRFLIYLNWLLITCSTGDLKHIWQDVNKIIDSLHIKNHKDRSCREKYDPQVLKKKCSTYNTMCCEQTFAWLSRFKKILCAMPKEHFHFYMHRMVKRRNKYIEYCYAQKRRPVLPKVRH